MAQQYFLRPITISAFIFSNILLNKGNLQLLIGDKNVDLQ